jgi:Na+/melibiose symporter-like transporter
MKAFVVWSARLLALLQPAIVASFMTLEPWWFVFSNIAYIVLYATPPLLVANYVRKNGHRKFEAVVMGVVLIINFLFLIAIYSEGHKDPQVGIALSLAPFYQMLLFALAAVSLYTFRRLRLLWVRRGGRTVR